jgi:hypothetical protein
MKISNPYISDANLREDLKLPDVESFEYGPLFGVPAPEESVISLDSETRFLREECEKDPWRQVIDDDLKDSAPQLYSWESFQQTMYEEPRSAYISDAGPAAFNAASQKTHGESRDAPKFIDADVFLKSLFSLGLGRSSVLFTYNMKEKDFLEVISHRTVTGHSTEASHGLIARVMECGKAVRHLRDYVEKTYTSGSAFSAKVALANAVTSVVGALEHHISDSDTNVRSLLQLQQAFDRPGKILSEIYGIVESMKTARSNEDMATLMFQRCLHCEQEPDWLRLVLLKIMARVSSPWLELAEEWIGLRSDNGFSFGPKSKAITFVECESLAPDEPVTLTNTEYSYRPESMPAFMPPEDGELIFEIGQSLRIIRSHHPDHPLSHPPARNGNQTPSLEWTFDWHSIESVVQKAKAHEQALAVATRNYRPVNSTRQVQKGPEVIDSPVEQVPREDDSQLDSATFELSNIFDTLSAFPPALPDELYQIILGGVNDESASLLSSSTVDFSPPVALTPALSFKPVLAAQSRLVNAASIRLFFRSHNLRTHLTLQRNFHLLGDGVFMSRLTAALFDPDLSTTERKRGVMRSGSGMGLKLGNRSTWPPASSELRLALMGILSESYKSSVLYQSKKNVPQQAKSSHFDLPGSLSFAIRQLSEAEAERIMNPESLYALDFLRLQYSPPSPLGVIITPLALEKYDTIFKFLLRLSRLLYTVSHLPHSLDLSTSRLFRLQAHHFVTRISAYFFDTGVRETWDVFTAYLDGIEDKVLEEDDAGELGTRVTEGIDDLRKQHELCLDRITFALLLRTRQQKVMVLLENIFGCILEFAKICNIMTDIDTTGSAEIDKLFSIFRSKVALFLDVCKGLIGKKGYGGSGGDARGTFGKGTSGEENVIERLVTTLDYNEYFSKVWPMGSESGASPDVRC